LRWSESKVWVIAAATTTRVNHLLSAGTIYDGAPGVAVWQSREAREIASRLLEIMDA
jgi:hypothetical protein